MRRRIILVILLFLGFLFNVNAQNSRMVKLEGKDLERVSEKALENLYERGLLNPRLKISVDSAFIDKKNKQLDIYYSKVMAYQPIREGWVNSFEAVVRDAQKWRVRRKYDINNYIDTLKVEEYIPNLYRSETAKDLKRKEQREADRLQHVKNISQPYQISKGLNNKHIALWGGHGRYYNNHGVWEWQRSNLFTIVEDMYTYSYIVPYLIPMLENAGANAYYPKERDTSTEEVIVDADSSPRKIYKSKGVKRGEGGFLLKDFYVDAENPFKMGSHLYMDSNSKSSGQDSIVYTFNTKENREQALYISYAKGDNVSDVKYSVYHDGGKTDFIVNQQMGYGTWVYLGKFKFNNKSSRVIVYNESLEEGVISSDAIKIGGGYNRIRRDSTFSPYPAYMNGARYFLQYAGMPDSTVYNLNNGEDDYKDDYQSRGEWVNYMLGGNYTFNRDSTQKGLNLPLDMSLSFHTDAGVTKNDSTIGTLLIHSTTGYNMERFFPDGRSRFSNRDLSDIVQSEIANEIHSNYNEEWRRRSNWDKRYSEATYPNVPSLLIELMSHQNFADMKYGLNPNFKFDLTRAIYKGFVKFLAEANDEEYMFTPLAVNSFGISYQDKKFVLNWEETIDEGEENCAAEAYIVYTKVDDGGFDNGVLVKSKEYVFDNIERGKIYSFKVKAVNKGGVSFDSEILSASIDSFDDNPILIINGFEKVSGPEYIHSDSLSGFPSWKKSSIADGFEYSYTGNQYNFDKNDPWITNPLTGHGASFSDYEGKLVVGNSKDYPYQHGLILQKLNKSFISSGLKAFEKRTELYSEIDKIDLIFGKQSTYNLNVKIKDYDYSVFRKESRDAIDQWKKDGKSILLSGAFIGSDVFIDNRQDTLRSEWVRSNLGYEILTNYACKRGEVKGRIDFNISKDPNERIYELRSVDAIKSINGKSGTTYRYVENNYPSAVLTKDMQLKVYSFGFPLMSVEEDKKEAVFRDAISRLGW